jgi:hypothetical protein
MTPRAPTLVVVSALLVAAAVPALPALLGGCDDAKPATALPAAGPSAIELSLRSEPPGAALLVDGNPIGASPQKVKLNPGPHRLRATMSGYYPTQDTHIQVGAGEPTEHVLTLVASH